MSNYQLSINNYQLPEGYKQTEVGVIPEDWEIRSCSEISERIVVGIVIRPTQYYAPQGVPAFRSANIREGGITDSDLVFISEASNTLLAKSQTRAGDILTVRTGYPGTSAVVRSQHAGCNCIDILITRPSPKVVNSDYLSIWINSSFGKDQVLRNQGGLAQKHFNVGDMRELLVALPKPEEQRAIATALSDVDALIAALDKLIAKKRHLKTATMQQLLTGKKRLPGFGEGKGYKQTEVGVIPEDWEYDSLQDKVTLISGRHILSENYNCEGMGKPYLTGPANFENGKSEVSKWTTENGIEAEKNDILITVKGSGAGGSFRLDLEGAIISRQLMALRGKDSICQEYLYCAFSEKEDDLASKAIGNLIPGLSRKDILTFKMALPPIAEQRAIATVLSDMDSEIAAIEARRAKTQAIKQGMMQQLLTGKVRLVASA